MKFTMSYQACAEGGCHHLVCIPSSPALSYCMKCWKPTDEEIQGSRGQCGPDSSTESETLVDTYRSSLSRTLSNGRKLLRLMLEIKPHFHHAPARVGRLSL